jgi:hypothetical protein
MDFGALRTPGIHVTESTEVLEPKATPTDYETLEERVARGKAIRERVPRRSHARWNVAPDRRDPIDILDDGSAAVKPRPLHPAISKHGRNDSFSKVRRVGTGATW